MCVCVCVWYLCYIFVTKDEEDIVDELRNTEEYQELLRIKQVKRIKEQEAETGIVAHHGYSVSLSLSSI